MKNIINILTLNFFRILIVLLLTEALFFCHSVWYEYKYFDNFNPKKYIKEYYNPVNYEYYDLKINPYIVKKNENSSKKPILLFGDETVLSDESGKFTKILSDLSGRNIYNYAIEGIGIQHIIKLLENSTFDNINPECIIFVYSEFTQNPRLYMIQPEYLKSGLYLRYITDKNGDLIQNNKKYPFYYRFYTVKYILNHIAYYKSQNKKETSDLLLKTFKKLADITKNKFPDTEFYLFTYNFMDCNKESQEFYKHSEYFPDSIDKTLLESYGFKVYDIKQNACNGKPKENLNCTEPEKNLSEEFISYFLKNENL